MGNAEIKTRRNDLEMVHYYQWIIATKKEQNKIVAKQMSKLTLSSVKLYRILKSTSRQVPEVIAISTFMSASLLTTSGVASIGLKGLEPPPPLRLLTQRALGLGQPLAGRGRANSDANKTDDVNLTLFSELRCPYRLSI